MPGDAEIEKREKGFWGHVLTWVVVGFCLLAIYVLSAGPVEKLAYGGYMGGNPIPSLVVFYAPLIWATDNNPFANRFFGWYMKFWHTEP